MEPKLPLRDRSWYAAVWWVLIIISGSWTLFNAYIGFMIFLDPAHNMNQGFAVIGWEIFLVISIPVYYLFIVLLPHFPQQSNKGPYKDKER